jgi:hypothetical protein
MAIANIIAQGIGFSPGSTKFIPTLGFISSIVISGVTIEVPLMTLTMSFKKPGEPVAWNETEYEGPDQWTEIPTP